METLGYLVLSSIFVGPAFYYAKIRPIYSLVAIILGLPTFLIRWHVGPLSFNTLDILIYGTAAIWFFYNAKEIIRFAKKNTWLINVIVSVFFIALAALSVSPDRTAAAGLVKSYFVGPLLFLFMTVAIIRSKKDLTHILLSFSVLSFVTSIAAIMQWWFPQGLSFISEGFLAIPNPTWQGPEGFRATSFLEYPNAVGLLLAPLVPILIYLHTLLKNKYSIVFNIISIVLLCAAIVLAKSKGALVALAVTAVIIGLYIIRKQLKYMLLAILFAVTIIPPSLDALITKVGPSSYSAQLRFIQWEETIQLLQDSPVFGAGLAGFQKNIDRYHTIDFIEIFLYPHNIILNFWVELGLVGMLVFMIFIIYSLVKSIQLLKKEVLYALTGIAAMMIILIHGIVDVPYFKNDLAVVFWFLWSWPFLVHKERWLSG